MKMEGFNKVGPWITLGLVCAIVLFFLVFFIIKLIRSRNIVSANDLNTEAKPAALSASAKQKLKRELVAGIEKTLERAL